MAKTEETEKKITKRSPVQIAEEAIKAKSSEGSLPQALPGSLSLSDIPPDELGRVLNDQILGGKMDLLKLNMMEGALKQSERFALEERQKLEEQKTSVSRLSPSSHPSVVSGMPGGILSQGASGDRASILDAALKNLESDEAKLKFINEHPELLSTSPLPFPGMQQRSSTSPPVSVSPTLSSPADQLGQLLDVLRTGMELQRASTPPHMQSPSQPVDQSQIVATFKDIIDKTTSTFTEMTKSFQEQTRLMKESDQAEKAALRDNVINLQKEIMNVQLDSINKDKEHLATRVAEMQDALSRPPSIPIGQFKEFIQQARDNGVPVNTDTVEQERIRAEIAREDKKLDHQLELERTRAEIERDRETRRSSSIGLAGNIINGIFEASSLKKHPLSSDASSVAGRF